MLRKIGLSLCISLLLLSNLAFARGHGGGFHGGGFRGGGGWHSSGWHGGGWHPGGWGGGGRRPTWTPGFRTSRIWYRGGVPLILWSPYIGPRTYSPYAEPVEPMLEIVTVRVGETSGLDVGAGQSLHCENLAIATVAMEATGQGTNALVVTGRQPGQTTCQVTDPLQLQPILVQVVVQP